MDQIGRFLKTMNFEKVDRVPDFEFGYWDETFVRWHSEGLPHGLTDNLTLELFFGFEQKWSVPVNVSFCPSFESKILEDKTDRQIIQDTDGVIYERLRGSASIPKYLKYPIQTPQDWEKIKKERLNPDTPERYPENWEELKKGWVKRDYPLGIYCGSLYGWLRNLMGVENISVAIATQPEWVGEMIEHLTQLTLKVIKRAIIEVKLDFSLWWEDICFSQGPLLSPKMFEKFVVPGYKKITSLLSENGIKINILDCDGKIYELVPLWLESGINCMFPIEASHTDPLELRKKFGKKILLMGGVNKLALIKDKFAIDIELNRLKPLLEDGGFIPHIDHRVPPDVSYENYLYYIRKKREMIGRVI